MRLIKSAIVVVLVVDDRGVAVGPSAIVVAKFRRHCALECGRKFIEGLYTGTAGPGWVCAHFCILRLDHETRCALYGTAVCVPSEVANIGGFRNSCSRGGALQLRGQ